MNNGAPSDSSRHPRALYVLFFTEMWERFSFYGMLALLALYMTKHLHFDQERSSSVLGTYTALVYLTPFAGGILADRLLGYKRSIVLGGLLMIAGHFLMAIDRLPVFFVALGLLILGNGAFKPNISTVVGKLYGPGDPRRDRGFTIFYMGINLGAFLSPLACGYLGERVGWHWGFSAAGVGMVIGLATFLAGQRTLVGIDLNPPARSLTPSAHPKQALTKVERDRILALVLVSLFVAVFWAGYVQSWNPLTLWADEHTDRSLLGFTVPASWFQSINPLFIIALAPLISALWTRLGKRGLEPSTPAKMGWGLVLLGGSFMVMAIAAGRSGGLASPWWLIGCYFLMTVGELALSPVGLSLVTKLAPARMGAMLMGVWFLASVPGYKLGGVLGGLWGKISDAHFFLVFVAISFFAALVFFLLLRPLARLMHDAK